ncbi:hypothetical protein GALMADRAFT_139905 [Galerina marginata CBS 339.88]|uniref:Uncharacterized protein n=1 Tax=Galerina marginata (strain CBS 339.88) TaxID=685588 RepID=A0A067TAZ7_GALM3|nr:hypothetical protein GALMADRAFT_139905 [Galerina marginata CBS 339.88]
MGCQHSCPEERTPILPTELLRQWMVGVDLITLHVVAKVDRRLREAVKDTLRLRIERALAIFVPSEHMSEFFAILTSSESVVAGSVAQAVLTPSIFANDTPNDLNIFVKVGCLNAWATYTFDLGYVDREDMRPTDNNVVSVVSFRKRVGDSARTQTIMICEGQGFTSITPVFGSSLTSQMNFFNESNIYCLQPDVTLNLKTIRLTGSGDGLYQSDAFLQARGIKVVDVSEEIKLCQEGKLCRKLERGLGVRLRGRVALPADAVVVQSWSNDNDTESFLEKSRIAFSLRGSCRNKDCGK